MFTGIVEAMGTVVETGRRGDGGHLRVEAPALADVLDEGHSVAVAGVCLTVRSLGAASFTVDTVATTLARTTLGERRAGDRVNLERAVRAGEPLGGHLVQGHVDEVGEVEGVERTGDTVTLAVRVGSEVAAVTVERGSLAIDGVSLTVAGMAGDVARFAIIPYTWSHTTLGELAVRSRVNVEADLIGKYVRRLLAPYGGEGSPAT